MNEKTTLDDSVAPNLEYHRNRAKALLRDLNAGEGYALWEFRQFHPDGKEAPSGRTFTLSDAQTMIARANGFSTWAQFKAHREGSRPVPANLEFIGFISEKLEETKAFYLNFFRYSIHLDTSDGLILRSPRGIRSLGFLRPGSAEKHAITARAFAGHGVYLTFSTDDVMRDMALFQAKGIAIETGPITTPGETLIMVRDPNGIGIYVSERAKNRGQME